MKARPSWHALVSRRSRQRASSVSDHGSLRRWAVAFIAVTLMATSAGLAQAATGGGGSSSGGSGGLLDSASTVMIAEDGFNGVGEPTTQGRGQASIDFFWNKTVSEFQAQLGRTPGTQGVQSGQTPRDSFNAVCSAALQNAADRASAMGFPATAAQSRVVGIYFSYAVGSVNWWMAGVPASEYSDNFAPSWDNEVNNPAAPGFAFETDRAAYARFEQDGVPALDAIAATWRTHVDAVIAQQPSAGRYFTCVALNEFEPEAAFQPVVSTQVSATVLNKGDVLTDQVTVGLAAGDQWVNVNGTPVPLVVRGTLYGPLSTAQATSLSVPAGAPVAAQDSFTVTGPGTTARTWTATASGTYAWVWEVRKADQGANASYVRADAADAYFAPTEQFGVRMTPQVSTAAASRQGTPGGSLVDQLTVSLPAGDVWPADAAGNPLPLVVRSTAYGPFNTAAAASNTVPAGAPVVGTELATFTGPGTKATSGTVHSTTPGFYTWVAEVRPADQSPAMAAMLTGPVVDQFMLEPETTSVRNPLTHSSQVREYNVAVGGRAFDQITLSGFPADHGTWSGLGGWGADVPTATVTTYGPFASAPTSAAVPAGAPVLTSTTIPARNGTYNIGYGAGDIINPHQPGYYVVVYFFAGDDRVAPFTSRADDVMETFYVPSTQAWLDMMSTATQDAVAGQGTMSDTVFVLGSAVPTGSTLTWYRCMWTAQAQPGCDNPVATYSTTVNSSGAYVHPAAPVPTLADLPAGTLTAYVGWAPVLTAPGGQELAREPFGTPSQTTTVRASLPDLASTATAAAGPGDAVTDKVSITGPSRADWTLSWQACWLDADGTCPAGSAFHVGDPVQVDPAVDTYTSPSWTVQVPQGTAPGTVLRLGWVPTLTDGVGAQLWQEAWGVDAQTTVVNYPLPSMTSTATPTAVVGQTTHDTVTVTGPVLEGTRLVWEGCYWISADKNGDTACRPDATPIQAAPVGPDGTPGVVLPALAPGQTLVVEGPERELTNGGLLPDPGLRFTWLPRIVSPQGSVLVAESWGITAQTTTVTFPPVTAVTKAYSNNDRGPWYGDAIGDRVTVTGDPFPGDNVTVRLYAWKTGTDPNCTGKPLAEKSIDLTASQSVYDTGLIYTTPADRTDLTYGFVETTTSRGQQVVSACGIADETVKPTVSPAGSSDGSGSRGGAGRSGRLASTGAAGVIATLASACVLVLLGGSAQWWSTRRRRRAPIAAE